MACLATITDNNKKKMLAASMLHTGLHKQDSRIIDLYLLIISGISSCLYSKAEMNPNKYTIYIISISKIKYILILTSKYNIKLLIKKYK